MNLEFEDANRASPSPLNGERAGVRGENGPARALGFMGPIRVRNSEIRPLHGVLTFNFQLSTFNFELNVRC